MTQTEDGDGVLGGEQVDVVGLVGRAGFAIAIDGDSVAMVSNRHLYERLAVGLFNRAGLLVGLGAGEAFAAGHPLAGHFFAKDDPVKSIT